MTKVQRRWAWLVALGAIVLVLIPIGLLANVSWQLWEARASLREAGFAATRHDLSATSDALQRVSSHLDSARNGFQHLTLLRSLPWIGYQIRAMEDALLAGGQTVESVDAFTSVAAQIQSAIAEGHSATSSLDPSLRSDATWSTLTPDEKRDVLRQIREALPRLQTAKDHLQLAWDLWQRVPVQNVSEPLRSSFVTYGQTLQELQTTIDEAIPMLDVAIAFAGIDSPMRTLVVLQNAHEFRPSGGFMGVVGTVGISEGNVSDFSFDDVYAFDGPSIGKMTEDAPAPIATYTGTTKWYLRDANWSPDFPTSADRMLRMYATEAGYAGRHEPTPTSIIAFEPAFFQRILEITGPIGVDGQTYDAKNVMDILEKEVEIDYAKSGIATRDRKKIIATLGGSILQKLQELPASAYPRIIHEVARAFQQKEILIYAQDPALLASLDAKQWTGRTQPTTVDSLWVVDANLGAYKTDRVVDREIKYSLNVTDPAHPRASVTLTYHHTLPIFDWRTTRYRTYTRVYVPEGAQLISWTGAMKNDLHETHGVQTAGTVDVTHELGKTVFGAFWAIEPGKTGTLTLVYELPPSVVTAIQSGMYQLDWQKQPGVDDASLTVDLLLGKNIESVSPPEPESEWGDASVRMRLTSQTDQRIQVKLAPQ